MTALRPPREPWRDGPRLGTFAELSGPAASAFVHPSTVFVQPIGATEHHGPHLPLSTDTLIAEATAAAASQSRPELSLAVLPTIAYGLSTEHIWAPGTVTLTPTTVLHVLDEVALSVMRCGGTRLAFLNAHGGNTPLLQVACREIRAKHGLLTFLLHPSLPPDRGGEAVVAHEHGLGIHGGHEETSVMLHLRPELVDMTLAERNVPGWLASRQHVRFGGAADFGWLSNDITASGVIGDPTQATPDEGKALFEAAVRSVAEALTEAAGFAFEPTSLR